jgi:hypothetical protein
MSSDNQKGRPVSFLEEILGGASCFLCFASRKTPEHDSKFDSRPVMAQPQASIPCPPLAIVQNMEVNRERSNQGHWASDERFAETLFFQGGHGSPSCRRSHANEQLSQHHHSVYTARPDLQGPLDAASPRISFERRTCPSPSDPPPPCDGPMEERLPTPLRLGPLPPPPRASLMPARASAPQERPRDSRPAALSPQCRPDRAGRPAPALGYSGA